VHDKKQHYNIAELPVIQECNLKINAIHGWIIKNRFCMNFILEKRVYNILMKIIFTLFFIILLTYAFPLFAERNVILTDKEKEHLQQHDILTYVSDPNWLPYEAYNSEYEHIGIIPEVIQLLRSNTNTEVNLRITNLKSDSWQDSLELAMSQNVDIITSDPLDPALQELFTPTDTYLTSPVVIIMTNNNNYISQLDYLKNKKIAVVENYGYVKKLEKSYPKLSFLYVESIQQGLLGVSEKKYDAFLASATAATYYISQKGLNNLSIVGSTSVNMEVAFFVKKDNVVLLSILNKLIHNLASQDVHKVMSKWSVVEFTQKIDYELIIKLGSIFLIVLIITLTWSHQLKKSKNLIKKLNTELSEKVAELEILSTTDVMTGLYNRRHFEKVFVDELNRAKRNNYRLVFAMLDVDHFKQFNDNYGHDKGDKVLIEIASIMQKSTQRANEFAFRIGGEEFCIITSDINNEIAFSFIDKLRKAIQDAKIPHSGNSASDYVTASFGVVLADNTTNLTTEMIFKTADNALYKAKDSGRNTIELVSI